MNLKQLAHESLRLVLHPGAIAVDATTGNGHDTVFLARIVSPDGHVYGFDIQQQAIESTRKRLQLLGLENNVSLKMASHARVRKYIPAEVSGKIRAVVFNLGYLPGSDKSIITQSDSTISALEVFTELLAPGGVISIMVYTGHAGGADERDALLQWSRGLTSSWKVEHLRPPSSHSNPPELLLLQKPVSDSARWQKPSK